MVKSMTLLNAVRDYLDAKLEGRKYCPECMMYLPAKIHEESCSIGKLIKEYKKALTDGK